MNVRKHATWLVLAAALVAGCGDNLPATSPVTSGSTSSAGGAGGEGVGGAGGGVDPQCTALAANLQQAVDDATTLPKGGTALAVITPQCGSWVGTSGEAHDGVPMAPEQLLRIGSVTKTYVAATVLLLVADGTLSLDDTLEPWVGGVPNGDTITLRQLLNHTSGVFNYTDDTAFMQGALANQVTSTRRSISSTWRSRTGHSSILP